MTTSTKNQPDTINKVAQILAEVNAMTQDEKRQRLAQLKAEAYAIEAYLPIPEKEKTITGDYNHRPEGWTKIGYVDFTRIFFEHLFKRPETRQIFENEESGYSALFDTKLFEIDFRDFTGIGIAIVNNWKDKKTEAYQFGDPVTWIKMEQAYAAQFANDNS